MSYRDDFTEEENEQFEAWAKHQRETNIKEMADSALVLSIYPSDGANIDIDYMLQTGAAVLLNKPIMLLARYGVDIPPKLRMIADRVLLVSDDDMDLGTDRVETAIKEFMEFYGERKES